ncbi:EAL domain-containing protein [Malaciobacter canalis]|uniref:EAL domain-containing protein n=1 Tax=Malaciobacter canalis TaxID=1912871 RepID=UPI0038515ECA
MKSKILYKMILIIMIPTLGMIFFSSIYIYNKYKTLDRLDTINLHINYVLNAEFLLNNLQKERGMSAGYIGSLGKKFKEDLLFQRKQTDKSKKFFDDFILGYDFNSQKEKSHIKKIQNELFKLEKLRSKVLKLDIDLTNELKSYNQMTNAIIDSITILLTSNVNNNISNKLLATLYLINTKEYAGLERAILSNSFSKKYLEKDDFTKIVKLVSLQNNNIKNFKNIISIQELNFFYNTFNSKLIEDVLSYREKIYKLGNSKTLDVDAKNWWDISTKRIDALGTTIEYFMKAVLKDAKQLKTYTINSLIYSFILWLIGILASIFSIFALRKITKQENQNLKSLKKQKKIYNILNNANELIIYNYTMEEVLNKACSFATKELDLSLSFICLSNKQDRLQIVESSGKNKNILSKLEINNKNKIYKKSLIERKNLIVNNTKEDKSSLDLTTEKLNEINSIAVYPLYKKDKSMGIMAFCSKDIDFFDEEIVTIFDKMTNDLSYGLEKEENEKLRLEYEEEIKLASYSFDSHEAMAITDANANIIKVNSSFTKITGYTNSEAIGNNPKILKSGKHSKEFYEKLWSDILNYGSWSGEIYNKRKNGEIYPERATITAIKNNMGETTHFIAQFFDITEIKRSQERLIHQIQTDSLTGLYNRTILNEKLNQAIALATRHKIFGGVIFIDLDNFKYINDSLGHDVGDLFLIEIAKRIKGCSRVDDIVIRLGGDEFVILVQNISMQKEEAIIKIEKFANKILNSLDNPIKIDKHKLTTTSSIGVALFPENNKNSIDIIKNADAAMYLSKEQGKNRVMFYHEDLDKKTRNYLRIENELREAIKENQFELYYQKKYDYEKKKVLGFEALIRWNHPTKKILYPDNFLDIAKKSDLIIQIGKWVLKTVINQISDWKKQNIDLDDIKVSINISLLEFSHPEFLNSIKKIIKESNFDTKYLEFEIDEASIFKDLNLAIKRITQLKELGISCSIDGFGVGYSSLNSISKIPVDTIKLNKDFLRQKDVLVNDSIINMVIEIAQKLNLKLIIEGVEKKEEIDYLIEKNSYLYQGYYFSKPLKAKDAIFLLNKK